MSEVKTVHWQRTLLVIPSQTEPNGSFVDNLVRLTDPALRKGIEVMRWDCACRLAPPDRWDVALTRAPNDGYPRGVIDAQDRIHNSSVLSTLMPGKGDVPMSVSVRVWHRKRVVAFSFLAFGDPNTDTVLVDPSTRRVLCRERTWNSQTFVAAYNRAGAEEVDKVQHYNAPFVELKATVSVSAQQPPQPTSCR